jgi:acyl carrier protein
MIGTLSSRLGHSVPLRLIFDHPTLGGFTAALAASAGKSLHDVDGSASDGEAVPASAAQLAVLAAEALATHDAAYTVTAAVRVTGIADWSRATAAAARVLSRHEVFTSRFAADASHNIVARLDPSPEGRTFTVELTDLSELGEEIARDVALNWVSEQRWQPVDLLGDERRPLTRVNVFRISEPAAGAGTAIVALVTHHALIDEMSADLVWTEIFGAVSRPEDPLPATRNHSRWARESMSPQARELAREAAERLAGRIAVSGLSGLSLPAPEPGHTTRGGASSWFVIPAELGSRADAAASRWSVPIHALLGTAVACALAQQGSGPFAIFMPMTLRRSDADFGTVGCLVTSLPVLADMRPGEPAADAVARWHHSVLATMECADANVGETEQLLRIALPEWAASPRISLAFEAPAGGSAGQVEWVPVPQGPSPAKHDLAIFMTAGATGARQCRIAWRPATISNRYAVALGPAIIAQLESLCGRPAGEGNAGATAQPAVSLAPDPEHLPGTATSAALTVLISEILGHPVRSDDDLFQAGATSLDLLKIIAAVRLEYGVSIRAVDIFDCPTPASLASAAARLAASG